MQGKLPLNLSFFNTSRENGWKKRREKKYFVADRCDIIKAPFKQPSVFWIFGSGLEFPLAPKENWRWLHSRASHFTWHTFSHENTLFSATETLFSRWSDKWITMYKDYVEAFGLTVKKLNVCVYDLLYDSREEPRFPSTVTSSSFSTKKILICLAHSNSSVVLTSEFWHLAEFETTSVSVQQAGNQDSTRLKKCCAILKKSKTLNNYAVFIKKR